MTYSGAAYSSAPYSGEIAATGAPIYPATIDDPDEVAGPAAPALDPSIIRPGTISDDDVVNGPVAPLTPTFARPIAPATIDEGEVVNGPWVVPAPPVDPTEPTIPAGPARVQAGIRVDGYPDAKSIQCVPRVNEVGAGSFTTVAPGPAAGDAIGVSVSGRRVFTGVASRITEVEVADGEEAAQDVQVELDGYLAEWNEVLVLPDLAASDTSRLGPPTQDTRVFDWTMNGLGNQSFGEAGVNLVPSVSIDARQAALAGEFPLPDVWPDPWARWMWVANPHVAQPRGWCHFRIPTTRYRGKLQLWAAAYDYAEVWMDGVPMITCDQPGVAKSVTIDSRYDWHLLTVKAYNSSGRAGVLLSCLPINATTGLYGEPIMQSRSNWKAVPYTRRSFVSTPGQVLYRLRYEARKRGVWPSSGSGAWQFDFGNLADSAGRPWHRDTITLDVGMTYLDVLRRLAENHLDFAAAPSQRRLRVWRKDLGTGRTVTLPWTEDVDMASRSSRTVLR